jgi:hypothetical protein
MPKINFNLKFFSSYYVTLLIAYFVLQIDFFNNLIFDISAWMARVLVFSPVKDIFSGGKSWLIALLSFTVFIFLVQHIFIIPIDLYIHKEGTVSTRSVILLFLIVFGFQIYIMNKVLPTVPMPADIFSKEIISLFDGLENTFNYKQTLQDRQLWSFREVLWRLGPVALLYYKASKIKGVAAAIIK